MSKPERMTDVEFERRIQVEPNTRVAMSVAYVEATRARAREEEQAEELRQKDAEIQRLRADLARLQPSGQVAEDSRTVLDSLAAESHAGKWCAPTPGIECPCEALRRITSQAQAAQVLADALENLLPPERAPGCWCPPSRNVDGAGHQPPCAIARTALRLAGRLP